MDTFRSSWGYHSVDFSTYEKLRMLHKRYWETVRDLARWTRWNRKTVNRAGSEPRYCPLFVLDKTSCSTFTDRLGNKGIRFHPKTLVDQGVREAFNSARIPANNPQEVKPLSLSQQEIAQLFEQVEAWFKEADSEHSLPRS